MDRFVAASLSPREELFAALIAGGTEGMARDRTAQQRVEVVWVQTAPQTVGGAFARSGVRLTLWALSPVLGLVALLLNSMVAAEGIPVVRSGAVFPAIGHQLVVILGVADDLSAAPGAHRRSLARRLQAESATHKGRGARRVPGYETATYGRIASRPHGEALQHLGVHVEGGPGADSLEDLAFALVSRPVLPLVLLAAVLRHMGIEFIHAMNFIAWLVGAGPCV